MSIKVITEKLSGASDPVYCHLTVPSSNGPLTLYLSDNPSNPPMGSLVYSLPHGGPSQVISTKLFRQESTINVAERVSNALAKKFQRPVIVGSSVRNGDNLTILKAIMDFVAYNVERS